MPEFAPKHPFVSILVAARNEESALPDCLAALATLDYPTDRYEVLIGNDDSTDGTASVAQQVCSKQPHVKLFAIAPATSSQNGKANALAQLAHHAKGEFLVTTDADVRVPRAWLTGLLADFKPDTGVVTGTTLVAGDSLWARLQAIDWLLAFGLIHLGTYLNVPLTGSGNNMAIRREAYDAVGGFENLPFSVVEDYTLFQAIVAKGYGYAHRLTPDVLAKTLPTPTLTTYLQQRKRWMRGAFSLPFPLVGGLLLQYLLVPMLLVLALFAPVAALAIFCSKWLFQSILLLWTLQRTQQTRRWFDVLLFEPYQVVLGALAMIYYLLPVTVKWKGRQY